jgi:hypothetical protein
MELDRFKTAWQQQPLEGAAARPLEDIMRDVHLRSARLRRQIWQRDLLESLAGIVVIGFFGFFAWLMPEPLAKAGALIIVAGCLNVMLRLHLARTRHQPSPDASAREFCTLELKRLDEQIHLLSTVGWWYIAPLVGGMAVFTLGSHGPAAARVTMLMLLAVLAAVVYWLNRRAVRHGLQPIRDDLARILKDMAAS